MPEIRRVLARSYGLEMSGTTDLTAHRDMFLRFLGFLKLNVAGQTSVRVAGQFASQVAIVQGMAAFRVPDLVLRHDRLEQGLAFIAAELGAAAPVLAPEGESGPFPLAAFVDDEIEAACREAYRRDYDTYAFTDWREG